MLRRLLPRPDAGEGWARFGVRLLVAALCAVTLLQAIRPAVYSARQGYQTVRYRWSAGYPYTEALQQLNAQLGRIPAGTRVAVVDTDKEWALRLSMAATLEGLVVVDSASGRPDLEIWREPDPSAPPYGLTLRTRPVRP